MDRKVISKKLVVHVKATLHVEEEGEDIAVALLAAVLFALQDYCKTSFSQWTQILKQGAGLRY